jgi:hypothetical protein
MPPPNGSIGSITDGSTSTAETFRQQNWRTPTTVKPSPAHLIQVGSSVSGNPSYGLGDRVLHDAAVLDDEEMAAPTGPSLASARLDCGGRERGAI